MLYVYIAAWVFLFALVRALIGRGQPAARPWLYFWSGQVVCFYLMVLGWVLLIPFALAHAWKPMSSPLAYGRAQIERWSSTLIDRVYGNYEDGVVPPDWYLPSWPLWLRVYLWTAWRNSTDNLKYVFHFSGGPFWRKTFGNYYAQAGWNGRGLPVLSAGRIS